jgi:hypothetical protein
MITERFIVPIEPADRQAEGEGDQDHCHPGVQAARLGEVRQHRDAHQEQVHQR